MPAIIKIENYPSINIKESAELASEVNSGVTALPLVNAQNVSQYDFLYIGRPGQEKIEKRSAGTVTGNSVAVSALSYGHPQSSPVLDLLGDKIQLYRAANVDGNPPADSAYSVSGTPVDIDPDQIDTQLTDATGSTAFWYKYVYYNSYTSTEITTLSQVKAIRGAEYGNYATVPAIRVEAGIQNNPYISDGFVGKKRAEAQDYINGQLKGIYIVPFTDSVPEQIVRITELLTAGYILKTEFGEQLVNTNANGQNKVDEAQAMLDKIINGSTQLIDAAGDASATRQRITGWPNSTTADTPTSEGGGVRRVRMGQRF